ncbi:MAG: P-loop NTPase, partial [Cryomorphaceae bacterium]
MELNIGNIQKALSNVMEPEMKKDVISLDLIRDIKIDSNRVSFKLYVLNPAMHSRKRMEDACRFAMERNFGKDLDVEIEIEVLSKGQRAPEQRKVLPGVKNIIAVASGKGGVGKSTVAANLAAGLALEGYSVGLVDADIYGPSMPMMFDVEREKPRTKDIDGKNYILPVENYGVKLLSIGFFADTSQAIVWRGPMASKALNQMFT